MVNKCIDSLIQCISFDISTSLCIPLVLQMQQYLAMHLPPLDQLDVRKLKDALSLFTVMVHIVFLFFSSSLQVAVGNSAALFYHCLTCNVHIAKNVQCL